MNKKIAPHFLVELFYVLYESKLLSKDMLLFKQIFCCSNIVTRKSSRCYQKAIEKEQLNISKKISVLREKEKTISTQIYNVEERMIFEKLSKQRGEDLLFKLSEERSEIENRILDLNNMTIAKEYQKLELFLYDNVNEDAMSDEEKTDIIRKVIQNVFISRESRTVLKVKVYNKINDDIYIYNVYCWRQEWELVEKIKRKNDPESSLPIPARNVQPTKY